VRIQYTRHVTNAEVRHITTGDYEVAGLVNYTVVLASPREDHHRVLAVALWMLVGWLEFNVPFQHKYGYIRDKRSGWRVILLPSEGKLAIY